MPSLAEAVEWAESRGNPRALSPKGAMGLMQLMPGTARDPGFGVQGTDNPWNPQENRRVGREYLDAMMNRYGGDRQAALAAYNWGPGNADEWVQAGKPPDMLPEETRNYIASVQGRAGGQQQGQSDMPQISDLNDPRLTRAMTTPQPRPLPAQGMPGPMTSALASGGVAANFPQGGGPMSQAIAGGQAQPQPQPQQAPQQQPTGGMQGGQQDGNMLTRLFGDPGFMQGLTVLGGGLEGQGLGTALTQSQKTRAGQMQIQREEERRKRWAQMFSGGDRPPILQGLPDETVAAIQALGPDQGRKVLGKLLTKQMSPGDLPTAVQEYEYAQRDPGFAQYQQRMAAGTEGAKTRATEQAKRDVARPEQQSKALSSLQSLERQHGLVEEDIDKALASLETGTTSGNVIPEAGTFGGIAGYVPGTDAYDVASLIETVKANIGFDKLQQMREESPTGGALGQVSEREIDYLQSVLGNLSRWQSNEQVVSNLKRIKEILREGREARQQAFQRDFGVAPSAGSEANTSGQTAPQTGGQAPTKRLRYDPSTGELVDAN